MAAALPSELNPNDVGAIMRALQRRQGGNPQPALEQQGPGGASPAVQPPNITTATPSAVPQGVSAQGSQPVPDDEKILIIKALRDRLKAISNVEQGQAQGL